MRRNGFTLIEILFATMILATGLFSLMVGLGNCAQMMVLSKEYQDAQFVFSVGERCYPIPPNDEITDPEEDERLNIDAVRAEEMIDDLQMELETNEEDDGLYVLRTRITWGSGKEGYYEELVRLIRKGK